MNKINVNLSDRSYPIYMTADYSSIAKCLKDCRISEKILIVTDENVEKLQLKEFLKGFQNTEFKLIKFVIKPGETSKNIETIKSIYNVLLEKQFDRNSTIIALGGGVVGDIAGFAGATFYRGINFIQVPTTLLAQSDSSVGGKVGIDFNGCKNVVGAFYQPRMVYINVNSLKTLPERELKCGLAEVVKHGVIFDAELFEYIEYNKEKIFDTDENVLQYIIKTNCIIKASVVEKDEKENDLRAILNFGHTIGHAIETIMEFSLLHGECVSLGMVGAFRIAQQLEMMEEKKCDEIIESFKKIGLMTRLENIDVEKVFDKIKFDKKVKNGKMYFVLPKKIGSVITISLDDEVIIKNAIRMIGQ